MQRQFFAGIGEFISLSKLIAMYRHVPKEKWEELRYTIVAVEAAYDDLGSQEREQEKEQKRWQRIARTAADNPLSPRERETLADCEVEISTGLKDFLRVGKALLKIRDGRLYRATHDTFEAYCRERWDIGRNYANKLIGASGIVANLQQDDTPPVDKMGTIVPIPAAPLPLPATESQARCLSEFDKKDQPKVWRDVVQHVGEQSEPITEKTIRKALNHLIPTHKDSCYILANTNRKAHEKAVAERAKQRKREQESRKLNEMCEEAGMVILDETTAPLEEVEIEKMQADVRHAIDAITAATADLSVASMKSLGDDRRAIIATCKQAIEKLQRIISRLNKSE